MANEPAETICKRMAELRRELTHDVEEVTRSAKAMASPSYYVKKFPWPTLAVAAGVGYMLIPKKKQVIKPDMEALAELIRKNHGNVNTTKAAEQSQGMVKTLAVMGLTWAAKAGMNYIVDQLTTAATKAAAPRATEPKSTPSPAPSSPVDEPTDVQR